MPRIFLSKDFCGKKEDFAAQELVIGGEEAFHIAFVLRMRIGEKVTACTRDGVELSCRIRGISDSKKTPQVFLEVEETRESQNEPPVLIRVFQGLPKGKKTDSILQKCTELGAGEMIFVSMDRSVPQSEPGGNEKKKARFEKICQSAAEQCGRGKLVPVSFLDSVEAALAEMKKSELAFACYEAENERSIKSVLTQKAKSISFLIGPEGGFSEREIALCRNAGVVSVGLGRRILRTETAASAVLAMILYEKEL